MSQPLKQFSLLLGFLLLLFVIASLLPTEAKKIFLRENGVIENATLGGYIFCIYLMLRKGGSHWIKIHWPLLFWIFFLFAREADLHSRYTAYSIFSTKLYFKSDASILAIVLSSAIVFFILWLIFYTLWKYFGIFLKKLKQQEGVALFILTGLMLGVVAKSVDGIGRTLGRFGMSINRNSEILYMQFEEIIELGIPLAFCLAVVNHFATETTNGQIA